MAYCEQKGDSVLLRVYTQPRASRTKVIGLHDSMLKISCCSPPVDGKANKEIAEFLSRLFSCAKKDVSIVRGHSSRKKQFLVSGMHVADVETSLKQYL